MRVLGNTLALVGGIAFWSFILFNNLVGVVSAIWLVIAGFWQLTALGIFVIVTFLCFSGFYLWPTVVLGNWGFWAAKRGKFLAARALSTFATVATLIEIGLWCTGVFAVTLAFPAPHPADLGWAYAVATGPWTYLALKDRSSLASSWIAFLAQLGCIAMIVGNVFFGAVSAESLLHFMMPFLIAALLVQITLTVVIKPPAPVGVG